MCGITAAQGTSNAAHIALTMTLCQQSRGVLGAGIAFIHEPDHSLHMLKTPGHPMQFANDYDFFIGLGAKSAICHNRQPSHGDVAWKNSHPFVDCKKRFALIHNGCVTGMETERKRLKEKGHKIGGETDSETFTHLICEQLDAGKTIVQALRVLEDKRQTATVLIIDTEGTIYGMKDYNPLVVCELKKGDERFIACASLESSIVNGVPNYDSYERIYHETSFGDIIVIKDAQVTIEKHKHKLSYAGKKRSCEEDDYCPRTPWHASFPDYPTGVEISNHPFSRQAVISTYKSPRQKRIDRINEYRRRRSLPDLTEAEKEKVIDTNCANEQEGCPSNCGDGNNNLDLPCFVKRSEAKKGGCADYDSKMGCPATKCSIEEPCFRPKGCANRTKDCFGTKENVICAKGMNCFKSFPTKAELITEQEVTDNDRTTESTQEPSVATGAGNSEPSEAADNADD